MASSSSSSRSESGAAAGTSSPGSPGSPGAAPPVVPATPAESSGKFEVGASIGNNNDSELDRLREQIAKLRHHYDKEASEAAHRIGGKNGVDFDFILFMHFAFKAWKAKNLENQLSNPPENPHNKADLIKAAEKFVNQSEKSLANKKEAAPVLGKPAAPAAPLTASTPGPGAAAAAGAAAGAAAAAGTSATSLAPVRP